MKNDKLISVRVPSEVYHQVVALAMERKQTVSAFVKTALMAKTWKIELRRNRAYHRMMLDRIKEVEGIMEQTERKKQNP